MENTNTNSKKSSTVGYTTIASSIEPSGQDTHQNTIKPGTPPKTSKMPSSQFNDSTPATQANQDWEEIEYPPRATSVPLAPHQGWGDEGLGFGQFAPTSPGYSRPSESELDERQQEAVRNMKHASMSL